MAKHTPGPFFISKETTTGQFVTETHIRARDKSHLALIGPCNIDANARLLAASPDLLDACEIVEKELNIAIKSGVLGSTWTSLQSMLADAIAKATEQV